MHPACMHVNTCTYIPHTHTHQTSIPHIHTKIYIYGFGRNVHIWHFRWPKCPWPKCPGRNVRNVRCRNILHSTYTPYPKRPPIGCLFTMTQVRFYIGAAPLISISSAVTKCLAKNRLSVKFLPFSIQSFTFLIKIHRKNEHFWNQLLI